MGYVERSLIPGEQVVYKTKLHWIVFAKSYLLVLIGLAGAVLWHRYIPLEVAGALAVVSAFCAAIKSTASEFAVTNRRVLLKYGVFEKHSVETLLSKIEGVIADQGILGRLLGYGTIVIEGTGGMKEPFKMIAGPLQFRLKVHEQIDVLDKQTPRPLKERNAS